MHQMCYNDNVFGICNEISEHCLLTPILGMQYNINFTIKIK